MTPQLLHNLCRFLLLAAVLAMPALSQIEQQNPELCGSPAGSVPVPAGVAAVSTPDEDSQVSITRNGSVARIAIYGLIRQVCPLGGDKLAIFATFYGSVVNDVYIVDGRTGSVLDNVFGDTALISPDQHWLAYKNHFVPQGEVSQSDEYLLYDLTKSPSENRIPGADDKGRVMYPVVPGNVPFNSFGLPDTQVHSFAADSLYWAPDSKSIVFADELSSGQLSIVLVRIGAKEEITAYVRPVETSEICPALSLSHADVSPAGDSSFKVLSQFRSHDAAACGPTTLLYYSNEFRLAETEHHAPLPPRKRAVGIKKDQ